MRFTTKTEYGLISLIHLAHANGSGPVTVKWLAEKENYSISYIEKILQALRQARIVTSQQGKQGGYTLARDPATITLKDIIEALEGATFDLFCPEHHPEGIICNHPKLCGLKPIWSKTKSILDEFYGSVTLDMLSTQRPFAAELREVS